MRNNVDLPKNDGKSLSSEGAGEYFSLDECLWKTVAASEGYGV